MDLFLRGERVGCGQGFRHIGSVQRTVAVSILRIGARRAGCAAFRVGFSKNNWSVAPLGKRLHDFETLLDGCELASEAHDDVSVLPFRCAFGMEQDEIELRASFLRDIVTLMGAMIEKTAEELSSFWIGGAGRIGAADASSGERAQNGIDGIVVQLEEFVLRALPVADVRL